MTSVDIWLEIPQCSMESVAGWVKAEGLAGLAESRPVVGLKTRGVGALDQGVWSLD